MIQVQISEGGARTAVYQAHEADLRQVPSHLPKKRQMKAPDNLNGRLALCFQQPGYVLLVLLYTFDNALCLFWIPPSGAKIFLTNSPHYRKYLDTKSRP